MLIFQFRGKTYRTDRQAHVVEEQQADGSWKRTHTGIVLRRAYVEVYEAKERGE